MSEDKAIIIDTCPAIILQAIDPYLIRSNKMFHKKKNYWCADIKPEDQIMPMKRVPVYIFGCGP